MPNRAAEKLERKINAWLRDHLILQLASYFEEKCRASEAEFKVTRPKGSFFMSDAFFVNIRFPDSSLVEFSMIVKLPNHDEQASELQNFSALFDNEILFYKRIADFKSEEYPKCYVAGSDPVFKKVIVLENLSGKGYIINPDGLNLSVDYVLAGLRSIASFHGYTYAMKENTPKKFNKIVKDIKLVRYDKENISKIYEDYANTQIVRVTKGLQSRDYDPSFTKQIEHLFENVYRKVLLKCIEPVEPLATIVHGDCTQNNIMFRKVDPKNKDLQAILIDFALIMYSSPATDVSLFIYMCLPRDDIKTQSEFLFKAYHDMLVKCMKKRNIWSPDKYNYEAFWQDYKQHAIMGYLISAFFLPIMTEFTNNHDLLLMNEEMIEQSNRSGGGEVLTNTLVDRLIDAREAGLLDFYLNNCNVDV